MVKFVYLFRGTFLVIMMSLAVGFRYAQLLSRAVGVFDTKVISGFTRLIINGTVIDCQMRCLWDDKCMSFFHNNVTGMCQTQNVVFFNPNDGQLSSGSRYYTQVQEFCPSDMDYIYNRALHFCYKFHYLKPGDYYQARLVCQGEGGDLVIIDTKEKFDHISWTIKASTFPPIPWTGFLIGASDEGYTARDWHWPNGQRVNHNIWNWCPNEPNDGPNSHHIAMVISQVSSAGCVKDVSTYPKHFVCERHM